MQRSQLAWIKPYLAINVQTKAREQFTTAGKLATYLLGLDNLMAAIVFFCETPLKFQRQETRRTIVRKCRIVRECVVTRAHDAGLFSMERRPSGFSRWEQLSRTGEFAGRSCRMVDTTGEYGAMLGLRRFAPQHPGYGRREWR